MEPRALRDRPKLCPEYRGYYKAFSMLSGRRAYNQAGLQPLAMSEITAYLTELGLSRGESRFSFLYVTLEMDTAFMSCYFKKQGSETK